MMKLVNTRLLGLTLVVTCVACSAEPETEVAAEAPTAPEAIALGPTVGPAPAPAAPGAELPAAGTTGTSAGAAPSAAQPAGTSTPAASTPAPAPAPAAAPTRAPAPAASASDNSVYAGVYTRAQANRGNQTQQRECGACHSPGDWGGGKILQTFNGRPLYDLTDYVRNTMPLDSPGRLTFEQYTDIMAFFLQLNNIPAGSSELPANEAAQRAIKIEYRR